MSAQRVLDQAYTLARLDALRAQPGAYAEALAAELARLAEPTTLAELAARDAAFAAALAAIDAAAIRAAKLLLEHALAADTSIPPPTRAVFAGTITRYAADLTLLARRARDVAATGGARDPDATAAIVVDRVRAALELRAQLRDGVLALVRERSELAARWCDGHARDRRLDEPSRKQWSAARRDCEAIAHEPRAVEAAPWAVRIASQPAQLDEPDPHDEPTFASMIELD